MVLWNYKLPRSSFNEASQFLTIDQIRHTILTVKLVKPKKGVFTNEVNYLLFSFYYSGYPHLHCKIR